MCEPEKRRDRGSDIDAGYFHTNGNGTIILNMMEIREDNLIYISIATVRTSPGFDPRAVLGVLDGDVVDIDVPDDVFGERGLLGETSGLGPSMDSPLTPSYSPKEPTLTPWDPLHHILDTNTSVTLGCSEV